MSGSIGRRNTRGGPEVDLGIGAPELSDGVRRALAIPDLRRRDQRIAGGRVLSPMVWVLSSGRPASALKGLRTQHAKGWPRGCYLGPPLLHFGVVQVVLPIMLRYRLAVPADPGEQTSEDREFLMSTQDALGLWEQQVLQRGIEQGIEQGRLVEARAALRRVLDRRNLRLEAGDEVRVEACRDVATLQRWLDQALTATSITEALR